MPLVEVLAKAPGWTTAQFYPMLCDFERYSEHCAAVRSIRVTTADDGKRCSNWEVNFQWGVLRWTQEDRFNPETHSIDFQRIEGDLDTFAGQWALHDTASECLIRFTAHFDMGISGLKKMIEPMVEQALRDAIESILTSLLREPVQFIHPATTARAYGCSGEGQTLCAKAESYLRLLAEEGATNHPIDGRIDEVRSEIARTGTYRQTFEEIAYGAQVAWRNSSRCIGRLYWRSLDVRDQRQLSTAEEIFEALVEHLQYATNEGKIRPLITVFAPPEPGRPGIRIWNSQLIRYAGYHKADGGVHGDPVLAAFTDVVRALGWQGGPGTPFDLLPIVIQMPNQQPRLFELPREIVLEVPMSHPDYGWFADLGLKWHAVPVISNMRLEIGGISYTAAPFNGWYMGTEIGARNFGDVERYNMLPLVADKMGLDTRSEHTLWKDRALVEINVAVLHSFRLHGVRIVDHHTAAGHFVKHEQLEWHRKRETPADWGWIVPPISGSATPLFHRSYNNTSLTPNFFYQQDIWKELGERRRCPIK